MQHKSMNLTEKLREMISKFEMLNEEEIELILAKTVVELYEKNTFLLKEGQIPTKCYMIVEGCVREYIIKDGEEKSTAFFLEGDTFTPYLRNGTPSKHFWVCSEDCMLTVSNESYEEEIRAALPRLDDVFQQIAIGKIIKVKEQWNQFVTSSPEERYIHLLETKPQLFTRVPQHQIASYLGMKPQSLSRIRKRIVEKKK